MADRLHFSDDHLTVYCGDVSEVLPTLTAASVNCVVTSPPYWGLRDYGTDGQLGLEPTPEEYVANLVGVFREVQRVLRDDGTVWLNLGDSYANDGKWGGSTGGKHVAALHGEPIGRSRRDTGLKPKDLVGIPWRVAFALQADGWYLRSDIIWSKPNPMPESVTDRPTKSHEYVFLLSKSARYYFDADAVREPMEDSSLRRYELAASRIDAPPPHGTYKAGAGRGASRGQHADHLVLGGQRYRHDETPRPGGRNIPASANRVWDDAAALSRGANGRNIRTVWTIATQPYPGAHFATFPEALVEPCVKAGCPEGGLVLDPFAGSGTTGRVANRLGRRAVLVELNPDYIDQAMLRNAQAPLGLT